MLVDAEGPTVYLVAQTKDLDKKIGDTQIKGPKGETRTISVKMIAEKDIGSARLPKERLAELHVIHDPDGIIKPKPMR
jgi:hypothetical protein